MRYPDQSLVGDLNDNVAAITSGSLTTSLPTSSVNENSTIYDLLPIIINRRPQIIRPIAEASLPTIESSAVVNGTGEKLYLYPDGNVKVHLGTSFVLTVEATQPPVLNVENGVPTLITNQTGLTYVWRRDGELLTSKLDRTTQSEIVIDSDTVVFNNVRPEIAGTYVCEISNDVGTITTEPINIEVFNLYDNEFFLKNLIQNPYGETGTDGWEANNADLTTKNFTKIPVRELIQPNRVDLFGYTVNMLQPNPNMILMGAIDAPNMGDHYYGETPSYFTRTRYKFDRKGGSFVVRAYQDIDLTEIAPIIQGGVYGVEGVRVLFGCYLGNAVTQFTPTNRTLDPGVRTDSGKYTMGSPRISIENFLKAGPGGVSEMAYVTIEEYDNETRLPSTVLLEDGSTRTQSERIVLHDPWIEQIWKYSGQVYYNEDTLGIGELSKGDIRDATLFAADELLPDKQRRFVYGQYAGFKRIVLNKLNKNTTKIRITLNFETWDARIFDQWKQAQEQSDEIFDIVSWQQPYVENKWSQPVGDWRSQISTKLLKQDTPQPITNIADVIPSAQDPHVMITGLNLALIPLFTQQRDITDTFTETSLIENPDGELEDPVTDILIGGRQFDPTGKQSKQITTIFKYFSRDGAGSEDRIEIKLGLSPAGTSATVSTISPLRVDRRGFFPFATGSSVDFEITTELPRQTAEQGFTNTSNQNKVFNSFIQLYPLRPSDPVMKNLTNRLSSLSLTTTKTTTRRFPSLADVTGKVWSGRMRYVLYFNIGGANRYKEFPPGTNFFLERFPNSDNPLDRAGVYVPLLGTTTSDITIQAVKLQTYYLDIDFSGTTTKVTLSRPLSLFPGTGQTTTPVELPHRINENGVLICNIPQSFVTKETSQGGFGYPGGAAVKIGRPSLIAVGAANPFSSTGSPVGGIGVDETSYIVTYAPVQDSVAGTYTSS